MPSCLLFDLDGTLIDSRADLAFAVNLMLKQMSYESLPDARVVNFVGEGMTNLIRRSLGASLGQMPAAIELETGLKAFSEHYGAHLLDATCIYAGVLETLEHFRLHPKAVVTNKPFDFTNRILEGLGINHHFQAVIGGDSLPERKPSAAPLLEAARRCRASPNECLMVGDSRIDILAGHAAQMKTCGFVAGFRGRAELKEAKADYLIERFSELIEIVEKGI
ncbi:MAG: HAD family hydrolase [Pyrinomonadaceae bacterium]